MADEEQVPLDKDKDSWGRAVGYFTGYKMPDIGDVFEDLKGNDKTVPLMSVEFEDVELTTDNALEVFYDEDLDWVGDNIGRVVDKDIVIPFYKEDGDKVIAKRVKIKMLGDSGEHLPRGGAGEGTEALNQYAYGSGFALEELVNNSTTKDFSWGGAAVPDSAPVDLTSFKTTALAFDRFQSFVYKRKAELEEWEQLFGKVENDKWRGQAAGVWWELVHLLVNRYERLYEDVQGTHGGSKQGEKILDAAEVLRSEAESMRTAWSTWTLYDSNPLNHLNLLLGEIMVHLGNKNLFSVSMPDKSGDLDLDGDGSNRNTVHDLQTDPEFSDQAYDLAGHYYGPLDSVDTWKNIGQEAIYKWWNAVRERLGTVADESLRNVRNAWAISDAGLGEIRPPRGDDLKSSFQEDLAYKEKRDAEEEKKKARDEEKKARDEAKAEAERERERERKYREEQEAKANKQREEDLRRQAEQEAKQDRIREEQEAKADKQREEDLRRQAEQEAKQDRIREEQEAKQEQYQKEQEQKQEEQEREQEQKQKEQEAKQEQQQKEQEAEQEQQQREAKEEQARQEAKQDRVREEQEAKQEEQQKEQEQKQKEQEAKQDRIREEQEAKQEEQQRRQEQMQLQQMAQQRAMQEQQRKEQEKREKEQEAEQEQQEREAKEEQARQEAKQDRIREEQKAEQEQQQKEAKEEQARQEAKQDRVREEQEAKQEEQQKE
ncbi:AAWKG family protein, partial [Streptomyces sp. NPDC057245]|uniref:AAWKG family protein n=1 Tax=Streptomyces sp. NPDC057245 TaxID=3346065 RepID=UPI00363E1564